ncbi:MAG TPA: hypothetical protein VL197_01930 [Nitrospirota bacterium]|nr:hypothetical protein [Nitrospirota bacterium]
MIRPGECDCGLFCLAIWSNFRQDNLDIRRGIIEMYRSLWKPFYEQPHHIVNRYPGKRIYENALGSVDADGVQRRGVAKRENGSGSQGENSTYQGVTEEQHQERSAFQSMLPGRSQISVEHERHHYLTMIAHIDGLPGC